MPDMLRPPSARPELVTDEGRVRGLGIVTDPQAATQTGFDGPLSRDRVVTALPTKGGPVQIIPATVFHDSKSGYLADPDGNLIGERGPQWINRLLPATTTWNTRRL
jgi:hypothetical protein